MDTKSKQGGDEGPSARIQSCLEITEETEGEHSQALTDRLLAGPLRSLTNLKLDKHLFPKVSLDEENAEKFIHLWGPQLLHNSEGGISSFLNAVMNKQFECARQLLKYAAEMKMRVDLCMGSEDVLGWAINHRSPECVDFVLKILTERHATADDTAKILNRHFIQLLARFPQILMHYLQKDKFCFEFGRFEVPLSLFDQGDECPVALVSDEVPVWEAESSEAAKQFWIDHSPALADQLIDSSGVKVMAVSKFMCVENALCHGMGNVLFPLVVADAPAEIFNSSGLRTLVQWKWRTYCRKRFCLCGFLHLLAAVFFSIFASFFGNGCGGSTGCRVIARVAISIAWIFVWILNFTGMRPRLRVISCVTVTALFVYAQIESNHHIYTAALTSLECISFWVSVLYYLQPFRSTGPLISMMRYVLLDMAPLVLLGFLIIVGFGFAFLVLFAEGISSGPDEFESPIRSFETLFHAMLGEFDPDLFHYKNAMETDGELEDEHENAMETDDKLKDEHGSSLELRIFRSILFNVYLFFGGVVLLTFLIAVLSDTYDKVKVSEQAELIKCRARIVGIWDGWNNMIEKMGRFSFRLLRLLNVDQLMIKTQEKFLYHFGLSQKPKRKFFHFLVPAEPVAKGMDLTWEGKIRAFGKSVKSLLRDNNDRMARETAELKNQLAALREEMAAMRHDFRFSVNNALERRWSDLQPDRMSDRIEEHLARNFSHPDSNVSAADTATHGQESDGRPNRAPL